MTEPMEKRVVRTPTPEELQKLNEETAAFAPVVADWSDIELTARVVASFQEMCNRDGEEAVLAFLLHWAARVRDALEDGGKVVH